MASPKNKATTEPNARNGTSGTPIFRAAPPCRDTRTAAGTSAAKRPIISADRHRGTEHRTEKERQLHVSHAEPLGIGEHDEEERAGGDERPCEPRGARVDQRCARRASPLRRAGPPDSGRCDGSRRSPRAPRAPSRRPQRGQRQRWGRTPRRTTRSGSPSAPRPRGRRARSTRRSADNGRGEERRRGPGCCPATESRCRSSRTTMAAGGSSGAQARARRRRSGSCRAREPARGRRRLRRRSRRASPRSCPGRPAPSSPTASRPGVRTCTGSGTAACGSEPSC